MNLLPFALLPGLTAAICAAHDTIQDGVEFLRAHMPAQDRGTVTQERLVREVRLALVHGANSPGLPRFRGNFMKIMFSLMP